MKRALPSALSLWVVGAVLVGIVNDVGAEEQFPDPSPTQSLFVSGHSLTDRPMLEKLEQMAATTGQPMAWDMQNIGGSSLRQRSMGSDPARPWSGFKSGVNRDGAAIDVLAEWRKPSVGGQAYDVLILTEVHSLLDAVLHQGTVTYLAEYRRRFHGVNPAGAVWFMSPWLSVSDIGNPEDWIGYERKASPVWRCVVEAAAGGAAVGEPTPAIDFIPASLALAELVEHLTSEPRAGFEGLERSQIMRLLFSDAVHLTDLGEAFVALIVLSTIRGLDPAMVDIPHASDAPRVETLKAFASDFMHNYRSEPKATCAGGITLDFAWAYAGYSNRIFRQDLSWPRAAVRRIRDTVRFVWAFRGGYGS